MPVTEQRRTVLLALAAIALGGWALTLAAVSGRPKSSTSSAPSAIESQITYNASGHRRLVQALLSPVVLHQLSYQSAGGPTTITWYDSDLESLQPLKIALVSLYVDGTRVASTVKTSFTGTDEDGQGDLVWRGTLTRGRHEVVVRVEDTAGWGSPYTDPDFPGVDELIIDRGDSSAP
jgi:hypothetical protein